MKFQFEPDLSFQLQAVNAVCDLFRGQEICRSEFTVSHNRKGTQTPLAFHRERLGIGNQLTLLDDQILANLRQIQLQNGLRPSETLNSGDFTVEMETGTGKTYVYLRTIFELNKRYGFTKFVIIVPSVAIKEGVYKTLQITRDHFQGLYSGAPIEFFLYDSANLGQVRNFVMSTQIQVMVLTVGAINKKNVNLLYRSSEKTGGEQPIDLIRTTRPILIVDEPQSVDGGLHGRGKQALDAMNSLCTLRYSATHIDSHHMIYRLDAVDAYERKLVKQIEVASATVKNAFNRPYVRLRAVNSRHGMVSAKVEIDIKSHSGRIERRITTVYDGDNLEQVTNNSVYVNCRIGEIVARKRHEFIELRIPSDECFLKLGESHGDVDIRMIQRNMIRRTIKEHLIKESRLRPQGIKVLSLFFVDSVNHYREYDSNNVPHKGYLARMFEDEYRRLMRHPEYSDLFDEVYLGIPVDRVHDGYFSMDKKGGWTNTLENNQKNRDNAERAYNLIMKDKERLLSFETPLKFIFSHSALREGWDNPNVFQICSLRDIRTERERRQTIGRGLRLCVNQTGERVRGFGVNTLTVIATESYEEFAKNLQKEIESETGIVFGIVRVNEFAGISIYGPEDTVTTLGIDQSKVIFDHLCDRSYIDSDGRVQQSLRDALGSGNFDVPEEFGKHKGEIASILRKISGRIEIKNADDRRVVRTRQAVLDSQEFRELWDSIKYKTTYRVDFDNDQLLKKCVKALQDAPRVPVAQLQWRKADIAIGQAGVSATEKAGAEVQALVDTWIDLPDVLTELQNRTDLTRRSILHILLKSQRLEEFRRNPQMFIQIAADTIQGCMRQALVDGIKYQRVGDDSYYSQQLFKTNELIAYLNRSIEANKSVYERVVYESRIEAEFAEDLEKHLAVKVYAKLPQWFTIPTPLGSYCPDWAILIVVDDVEQLYFVVETKGSTAFKELRGVEHAKIECGKAHFRALESSGFLARYEVTTSLEHLLSCIA